MASITQSVVATATGLGTALSNGLAGFIIKHAGYNAAFLFLAAMAALVCALFYFLMPETKTGETSVPGSVVPAAG